MRLALVVGSDVGPDGERKLAAWRWLRLPEGARAIRAAATLRPVVIIVKDAERPISAVAELRTANPRAAILVLARRYSVEEGRAAVAAGAQFYGEARLARDQDALIAAAIRAVRRAGSERPGLPLRPSGAALH